MKKLYTETFWYKEDSPFIRYLTVKKSNDVSHFAIEQAFMGENTIYENTIPPTKFLIDKILDEAELKFDFVLPESEDFVDGDQIIASSTYVLRAANEIARNSRRGSGNLLYHNITDHLQFKRVTDMLKTIEVQQHKWLPRDKAVLLYRGETEVDSPFMLIEETDMFVHPMWASYVAVLDVKEQ